MHQQEHFCFTCEIELEEYTTTFSLSESRASLNDAIFRLLMAPQFLMHVYNDSTLKQANIYEFSSWALGCCFVSSNQPRLSWPKKISFLIDT